MMRYTRVYNDDGGTRFEDCETTFAASDFAPPAPPIDVSTAVPVRELVFLRFAAGWSDPAHPAPARQWMFILSGRGETTAGAETKSSGAGDVFLLEDAALPDPGTTILEDAVLAAVRC